MSSSKTKQRYFKFLPYPDRDPNPDNEGPTIPLPTGGGVITDPLCKSKFEFGDSTGLYYTGLEDAMFYSTYWPYVCEVFPIKGVPVKRCKDDDHYGYYSPSICIGPVHKNDAEFQSMLIREGSDPRPVCEDWFTTYEIPVQLWWDCDWKFSKKDCRLLMRDTLTYLTRQSDVQSLDWYHSLFSQWEKLLAPEHRFYMELYQWLKDPLLEIEGTFDLIPRLKNDLRNGVTDPFLNWAIHQYLIRLRTECIVVYATCSHEFPQIFEELCEKGLDPEGFEHLVPKYHGLFDDWRFYRKHPDLRK